MPPVPPVTRVAVPAIGPGESSVIAVPSSRSCGGHASFRTGRARVCPCGFHRDVAHAVPGRRNPSHTSTIPPYGQSPCRWPVSFATALAVRLSAATVPPQARCASFIPRPAHRGKDPSLEEAFFDLTRNETDYHAGQLTGSAKGI